MDKIKILWFSNIPLDHDIASTGSWLIALSRKIKENESYELINISWDYINKPIIINKNGILQYIFPKKYTNVSTFFYQKYQNEIIKIIDSIHPHLIHVWGVEHSWGLITSKIKFRYPILLEIQGLKGAISEQYYGDLDFKEKLKTIRIKEILKFSNIFTQKKAYQSWGKFEEQIIKNHNYISIHSNWANSKVRNINNDCTIFQNERLLRDNFYNTPKWKPNKNNTLFTSLGYVAPFKGLHVLIKALSIIREQIPSIKLNIAGNIKTSGIKTEGYIKYILFLIRKLNLEKNVIWLGGLESKELIDVMLKASIGVFPSFVESYGLAMAESMYIGLPTLSAYNGGYDYLGRNEHSVLFYPPKDYQMCAHNALRILQNESLQTKLSLNAIEHITKNNDPVKVINNELDIYKTIIALEN